MTQVSSKSQKANKSGNTGGRFVRLFAFGCAMTLLTGSLAAGQLTYTPVNPSFGGSPFNGDWLLNQSLTQGNGPGTTPSEQTNVNTNVDANDLLGNIDTIIGIDIPNNNTSPNQ